MSEMVERVARAMCERCGTDWLDTSVDEYAPAMISRPFWMQMAKVAIEAMREPTDNMCAVALNIHKVDHIWRSMIQEALDDEAST